MIKCCEGQISIVTIAFKHIVVDTLHMFLRIMVQSDYNATLHERMASMDSGCEGLPH